MTGIYKITNKINGHAYVGQSVNIEKRWENHRCQNGNKKYPIYRAFRKYGLENFDFEVLEECEPWRLAERESHYIQLFQTTTNGYNQTESTTNPMLDPKIKAKAVKNSRAAVRTPEHRKRLSEQTAALWQTEEYREKVLSAIDGSRDVISKKSKAAWKKKDVRKRITDASKERMNLPENRATKSAEIKAAWARGAYDVNQVKELSLIHAERMKSDDEYRAYFARRCGENRPNAKAISMISIKSGEVVQTFQKLMDAAKWVRENTDYNKADYSTIRRAASTKIKAYGYMWEIV